jgi:cytochrome b561
MSELPSRYSGVQKALHWTMAALIVVQVAVGIAMTNLGEGPVTNFLFELHKSIGLTVLALALVRLAVRSVRGAPPFEPMPDWQRRAAQASHAALYVLFILVPLVGWIATSYCCKPVNFLWAVPVSLPIPDAPTMEAAGPIFRVHIALAVTLLAVVAIHVAGALQHHFIRRDRTLLRMLPGGE